MACRLIAVLIGCLQLVAETVWLTWLIFDTMDTFKDTKDTNGTSGLKCSISIKSDKSDPKEFNCTLLATPRLGAHGLLAVSLIFSLIALADKYRIWLWLYFLIDFILMAAEALILAGLMTDQFKYLPHQKFPEWHAYSQAVGLGLEALGLIVLSIFYWTYTKHSVAPGSAESGSRSNPPPYNMYYK